ncbi:MAG: GNAT family N-acetyltransferase [Pseudomonadota bacterium]
MTSPTARWIDAEDEARPAAEVLADFITADPTYICFAEYRDGLSPDGRTWAEGAADKMARVFVRDAVQGYPILVMENDAGAVVAGAVVGFRDNGAERFAIIEDFVVSPDHRGAGLGRALLDAIFAEAERRGAGRLLLETGRGNAAAQKLFERAGFAPMSTMYECRPSSE